MTDTPTANGHAHWRELYHEVVDTGLCTGCAACVMACPRDVLGYTDGFLPIQIGEGMDVDQCVIGDRGCDICTRACPRFRAWESDADMALFGRERDPETEPHGVARTMLLARASESAIAEAGQDGGLVTALITWGLANDLIDGALASRIETTERGAFDSVPTVITTPDEAREAAGSRYTYAATPLAMAEAEERGLRRLALVGMSCQASINGTIEARGVNKYRRKIALTLGLMCSKTFTYEGQREVLAGHGVDIEDVAKVDIKGRMFVSTTDGRDLEIPLKELHPHTRPGCQLCPDFAAQHADISCGGIGDSDGWTLTVVRTARGEQWITDAVDAGAIEVRPADEDPAALRLLDRLSAASRKRWPGDDLPEAHRSPGIRPTV